MSKSRPFSANFPPRIRNEPLKGRKPPKVTPPRIDNPAIIGKTFASLPRLRAKVAPDRMKRPDAPARCTGLCQPMQGAMPAEHT